MEVNYENKLSHNDEEDSNNLNLFSPSDDEEDE